MNLNDTIAHITERLENLREYEKNGSGYQPCIDEYENVLTHLTAYRDSIINAGASPLLRDICNTTEFDT